MLHQLLQLLTSIKPKSRIFFPFFFPVWKFFLLLRNNFLQKLQPPSKGFSSSYLIFELLCYSSFLSASPLPLSPLPISRIIKFTEWKPFKTPNYCWRWRGHESQVPWSPCLLAFLTYCILYFTHQNVMLRKLHDLKNRGNNRKERGRKGLTLVLLLMFAYKKIGKKFLSLTAITAILTVSKAWIMRCQLQKKPQPACLWRPFYSWFIYLTWGKERLHHLRYMTLAGNAASCCSDFHDKHVTSAENWWQPELSFL